ncbi:MAG: CHAT domain-containing protein [Bacteroidetes bacterium]|nr:CHAT domain-containing protein [Bacteroidota bacterium]
MINQERTPSGELLSRLFEQRLATDTLFSQALWDTAFAECRYVADTYAEYQLWDSVFRVNREVFGKAFKQDFTASLPFLESSLDLYNQLPDTLQARIYELIGYIHYVGTNYAHSAKAYKRCMELWEPYYLSRSLRNAYNMLGNNYTYLGDYNGAIRVYEAALAKMKDIGDARAMEAYHDNISGSYMALKKFAKAEEHIRQALALNPEAKSKYQYRLAENYKDAGDFDRAIEAALNSLDIRPATAEEDQRPLTSYYELLAEAHLYRGDVAEAIRYSKLGLQTALEEYPDRPREHAKARVYLAEAQIEAGQNTAALANLQAALSEFIPTFQPAGINDLPKPEQLNRETWLMICLKFKAKVYEQLYEQTGQKQYLQLASRHYALSLDHVNDIRKWYTASESKTYWGKYAIPYIEGAAAGQLQLRELDQDQDQSRLDSAFQWVQTSNAYLLRERVLEDQVLLLAGVAPDSVTLLRAQRAEVIAVKEALQTDLTEAVRDSLLQARQEQSDAFELLQSQLKRQYPDYARMRAEIPIRSISEVQEQLNDGELLLKYFVGEKNILAFALQPQEVQAYSIPLNDSLLNNIDVYRRSLSDLDDIRESRESAEKAFLESGRWLYQKLVAPALNSASAIEKISIIPDGLLGYLVFDCLLLEPADSWLDYEAFLIGKYNINYYYAVGLTEPGMAVQNNGGFVGFGIEYSDELLEDLQVSAKDSVQNDSIHPALRGKKFGPLNFADDEVYSIQKRLGGDVYINEQATKKQFLDISSQHQFIHIAAHGFLDENPNTDEAYLIFHPEQNDDQYLLGLSELYQQELSADLVVLSACQTGIGSLREGEGIMSIARAFQVAGSRSVVGSHWNLTDQATYKIMDLFYQNLVMGQTKSEALRLAKLEYLSNDRLSSPAYRIPAYWAATLVIGDDTPLLINKKTNYLWWLGGIGLILVLGFGMRRWLV